jgi:hypothetical protein
VGLAKKIERQRSLRNKAAPEVHGKFFVFSVGTDHFAFRFGLEWFGEDGVAVVIVKDHFIFVASTEGGWEAAGLVGVDLTGDFNRLDIDHVGASLIFTVVL